jgi:transcriptional regulator with XRE-family HTH domain
MDLHYKIRNIRDEQRLTQDYMASQLGISLKAYNEMETGKTDIRNSRLEAIAKILGKTPAKIYTYPDKESPVQNNTFNEQHANAVNAINIQNGISEQERTLYEQLVQSHNSVIEAKDALISSQNKTISILQEQLNLLQ